MLGVWYGIRQSLHSNQVAWLLCKSKALMEAGVLSANGRRAPGQRRALGRCRSDGCTVDGNVEPTVLRWEQGGTKSGGARSNILGVGTGARDNIVAPIRCGFCIGTGAPIMLLDHAGLEMSG